jgi:MinD-like ATPase involved in chromosome partitioning or flagellar assembly
MSTAEQQRQQVTVVSPFGQHRVDLPVHVPLSRFLPDVLAMAGLHPNPAAGGDGWRLADADGRILAADSTLAANRIPPGAFMQLLGGPAEMLRLGLQAQAEPADAVLTAQQEAAGPLRPPARTSRGERTDEPPLPGTGRAAIFARDRVQLSRHVPRSAVSTDQRGDSLTPLERTEELLPRPARRVGRLASAVAAFYRPPALPGPAGRPGPLPATGQTAEPGHTTEPGHTAEPGQTAESGHTAEAGYAAEASYTGEPGQLPGDPADAGAGSEHTESKTAAMPDLAFLSRRAYGSRLMPSDLTLATAPTRLERGRARWRELDYIGQLDAMITEPRLQHCATIAVVSPKGGVGKTTVTALLGTLLSLLRRDPIVAVDTNPDFGSLGRVLTPDQSWYVDDLAQLVAEDDELSLTALDSHLGRAVHGLLVVPAPTDPARMAALDEEAYSRVITRLKDFFSLILLDCGTGLQDPASAAAIAAADQVVLLTDAQPATASLVAESTDLLHQWGRPITVVVNRMPAKEARLDVQQLSRYLPAARGLVVVPDDQVAASRLAAGSFDWRDGPASWQLALRQLAIVLVSDWQRLGLAR